TRKTGRPPTTSGWKKYRTGVFRDSFGGDTRFPHGTLLMAAFSSLAPKRKPHKWHGKPVLPNRSYAIPTSLTPASRPHWYRLPPWDGLKNRPTSSATFLQACWSPDSTSSNSGLTGW